MTHLYWILLSLGLTVLAFVFAGFGGYHYFNQKSVSEIVKTKEDSFVVLDHSVKASGQNKGLSSVEFSDQGVKISDHNKGSSVEISDQGVKVTVSDQDKNESYLIQKFTQIATQTADVFKNHSLVFLLLFFPLSFFFFVFLDYVSFRFSFKWAIAMPVEQGKIDIVQSPPYIRTFLLFWLVSLALWGAYIMFFLFAAFFMIPILYLISLLLIKPMIVEITLNRALMENKLSFISPSFKKL